MEIRSKHASPSKFRKLIPYALSCIAGFVVLAALVGGFAWSYRQISKTALKSVASTLGYNAFLYEGTRILPLLLAVPGNYLRDVGTPQVVIDIKFKHWKKILAKRDATLAERILTQEDGDFVPAVIRYSDGKQAAVAKVKMRLKGDWLDHLRGDKWSFRVRTKKKDHFFGMRRFSLQRPETRMFQLEPMFLSLTKSLGILAPRYFFVDLIINGKHIGVMAVEEVPSKELLEASGRKESVIIRFSERYLWNWRKKNPAGAQSKTPIDDYRLAPIDAFQTSRVTKSPVLSSQYRIAAGLLRGFSDDRLLASKVFDAELMGRFLAAAELFGAWHGIRWHNLRFYFNPVTTLLEPIPFDVSSDLQWDTMIFTQEPIVTALLADEDIERAFRTNLKSLITGVLSGDLQKSLAETEAHHLPRLQKEYVLHDSFPLERLVKRASMLKKVMFEKSAAPLNGYDQILFAREYSDDGKRILTLLNAMTQAVVVARVYATGCIGEGAGDTEAVAASRLPLTLPPAQANNPVKGVRVELTTDLGPECSLFVDARLAGSDSYRTMSVDKEVPALDTSPLPASTVSKQLASRGYLAYDADKKVLNVVPGDHMVTRDIVVPAGQSLLISAGTTLRFAPGVAIVAFGPVRFQGEPDAPVVLQPSDEAEGWSGIAVLRAGNQSYIGHTRIVHTVGVEKPGWVLTGGVNFYESNVEIVSTNFTGHRGEDALNIVRSSFVLDDVAFEDTLSDAFDSDFSTGRISNATFVNIGRGSGGDGVDTSGSQVEITGASFRNIADKAISVGEASNVSVQDIKVVGTGIALASKDGSTVRASKVSVRKAKFAALMAYTKKPEYGGASIIAQDVSIEDSRVKTIVQRRSQIVFNGREMDPEDINIDALYDTVMKSDSRR